MLRASSFDLVFAPTLAHWAIACATGLSHAKRDAWSQRAVRLIPRIRHAHVLKQLRGSFWPHLPWTKGDNSSQLQHEEAGKYYSKRPHKLEWPEPATRNPPMNSDMFCKPKFKSDMKLKSKSKSDISCEKCHHQKVFTNNWGGSLTWNVTLAKEVWHTFKKSLASRKRPQEKLFWRNDVVKKHFRNCKRVALAHPMRTMRRARSSSLRQMQIYAEICRPMQIMREVRRKRRAPSVQRMQLCNLGCHGTWEVSIRRIQKLRNS